ncbi:MAG: bifunctional precorrin-2 dehydrogenase/sirohydrochlorin ferrochelatase [Nitrososphaerales archaeon]
MLIDILIEGQKALVVGGGKVGGRKTLQLLDAGAEVTVVSKEFTEKLLDLSKVGDVNLERVEVDEGFIAGLKFKPKVVIVALDDRLLNKKIAEEARSIGALVSVVDDPSISDFAMPAVAKVGDIRIGVSTRGSSPAMAGIIRRRVEKVITKKDVLQVELQKYARSLAKKYIPSPKERRKVLHSIIDNSEVARLLEGGKMDEARDLVKKIIIQARRSRK